MEKWQIFFYSVTLSLDGYALHVIIHYTFHKSKDMFSHTLGKYLPAACTASTCHTKIRKTKRKKRKGALWLSLLRGSGGGWKSKKSRDQLRRDWLFKRGGASVGCTYNGLLFLKKT
jgi:hypothetical protein